MGFGAPLHWLILAVVLVVVLGGGRFSTMMSDVAKGVKNFKKGMAEEDEGPVKPAGRLEAQSQADPAFDREGKPVRDER